MSVKVAVGILLLHWASDEDRKSPRTGPGSSNESSPCSNRSETSSAVGGNVAVGGGVEVEGVRQRTASSVAARKTATECRKQRSLSEVERYTLVSNRIV